MKQYLMIRNKGLIIPQDIILMGSSTKRGDDTKIGQFGSGAKFALSWLMRNDCKPLIYSGKHEIPIETKMVEHRGFPRDVIYVNGENTNITTELGLKWTCWMAMRELISNAIDEGGEKIDIVHVKERVINFCDDENTHIFIPLNNSLKDVMDNYDKYFAFDRQPDWIGIGGMIYLKRQQTDMIVYRKGIRCLDSVRQTLIDFNFNNIAITEDRLIEGGEGEFDRNARNLMDTVDDIDVLKAAILSEYKCMLPEKLNDHWIEAYRQLLNEGHHFTTESLKKLIGVLTDGMEIPAKHFKALIDAGLVSNPIEAVFQHLDFVFKKVEGPSTEVEQLLSRVGNFKVYFGEMDTYNDVKVKQNEFFVKHHYVKKDVKDIAARCLIAHSKGAELISKLF